MADFCSLVGVNASKVADYWPDVSGLIAKALERGGDRFGLEDIRKSLDERDMQLWLAVNGSIKSVCITEIRNYPKKKVCSIVLCTGEDAKEWAHLIDDLMSWAKVEGCQSFESWSRPGWQRVLKGKLKMTHVMLERDL